MSAPAPAAAASSTPSEQEIVKVFSGMLDQRTNFIRKIGELEGEWSEHKRVHDSIKSMDPSRRAYQLINSVLVETTVGEVIPKIEANKDGLASVVGNLQTQLDTLSKEIQSYQTKYNIVVQKPGQNIGAPIPIGDLEGADGSGRNSGVLVDG